MKQPNLLFLFTDEQRCDTLAAYGNNQIDMPNLNRLAAQSIVFDKAYVTQPVCTPSRASLLTGLYPHTTGLTHNNIPLPGDIACFPEMLRGGGYVTGYHGKWHLGDEIFPQHGFDDWVSIEDNYIAYYSEGRDRAARSSYHHFLCDNGFEPNDDNIFSRAVAARVSEEFGKPAFLAREASRFIRENRRDPFVLFVNFLEPHMPFFGPRDDQYDPGSIPLPPNYSAPPSENQPLKTHLLADYYTRQGHSGIRLDTDAGWRRLIARYWGLNSLVDTYVGEILRTLEDCGLDDNTIIVFTSDHGDMMGSHRLVAKCVMFEEAVRVPLMIHFPGQKTCGKISRPVSQIDLVPTLLDWMAQPVPEQLEGRSLRAEITGGDAASVDDVIVEWSGGTTGVPDMPEYEAALPDNLAKLADFDRFLRSGEDHIRSIITPDGWKMNVSRIGEHELYNLGADPFETCNLAGDPAMRSKMEELASRIRAWQNRMGDIIAPVEL